jgi:hypothetical protein
MKPRVFKTKAGFDAFVESHAKTGGAFHVAIMHDSGCSPNQCACNPWFRVEDMTAEAVLEGAAKAARWRKETAS